MCKPFKFSAILLFISSQQYCSSFRFGLKYFVLSFRILFSKCLDQPVLQNWIKKKKCNKFVIKFWTHSDNAFYVGSNYEIEKLQLLQFYLVLCTEIPNICVLLFISSIPVGFFTELHWKLRWTILLIIINGLAPHYLRFIQSGYLTGILCFFIMILTFRHEKVWYV